MRIPLSVGLSVQFSMKMILELYNRHINLSVSLWQANSCKSGSLKDEVSFAFVLLNDVTILKKSIPFQCIVLLSHLNNRADYMLCNVVDQIHGKYCFLMGYMLEESTFQLCIHARS